jgi:hypothetical protein
MGKVQGLEVMRQRKGDHNKGPEKASLVLYCEGSGGVRSSSQFLSTKFVEDSTEEEDRKEREGNMGEGVRDYSLGAGRKNSTEGEASESKKIGRQKVEPGIL